MRRAMSWVYSPQTSRTAIVSTAFTPPSLNLDGPWPSIALAGPPQLLRLLEDLAFRLDRRRDDQLGLLQLADVLGPDGAHARADRAHEVQRAVLGERRAEQDLLERARDADANARAARQVLMRRRHAPVISPP